MSETTTIDTLELEIVSSVGQADKAIDKLCSALFKLQQQTGKFQNTRFGELTGGLKQLSGASRGLDIGKVSNFSLALKNLSDSIKNFSGINKQITPTIRNLEKLSKFDFSKLQISGNFSGFSSLASGIDKFAVAVPKLAAISPKEINRVVKAFEKLATINLSNLGNSLQSLNGVDISVLEKLGTTFQSFAAALSGSEKIPSAIGTIFNSLSQLAASAGNIPLVTSSLPELTIGIQNFISAMAQSPIVQQGTTSLVTALSGIANAGGKAQKVVDSLPGLTTGIRDFISAMAQVPTLDKGTVKAIEALAQLTNAGAKAGSAAQSLQKRITGLSVSMYGLKGGAKEAVGGLKSFTGQILSFLGLTGGFYGVVRAIKSSIEAASDLSEAQNVIEQGFGPLIGKIEDFSKTSIQSFGMSELAAKRTAGIFAVMGKSLGLIPDVATDMAVSLTSLTADLASFYNISQDVARTALQSIFTGETESLKKLGVVMTQANLQAFALSQGINQSVKTMSQAELVQLRYAYVLEATSSSMGDFARTAGGSWANQVRILSQSFQQLGGIVGSGLMAAFLPVIKTINAVMAKILQLATVISSFLGKLFGFQKATANSGAGLAGVADSAGLVADNTEAAAGGISDIGAAAGKAEKKVNKFAASWHEVTSLSSDDSTSGGGGGGGAGGGVSIPEMEFPSSYTFEVKADDKVSPILDKIRKRFLDLGSLFLKGFKVGLGDLSVFDSILLNLQSIKNSLLHIFTDTAVVDSFNQMMDTLAYNAGVKTGAFVSIGASIIDNLTGGAASYLESAKGRIQEWLISMFDITAETDTIVTNFTAAVADIFTVFRSDDAKQITSDLIQIFTDGFMAITELSAKLGRDILALILNPITENAGAIGQAIENTLGPIEEILGTLADSFTHTWETINQTYDKHLKPTFDSFTKGISEIVKSLLDGYNNHIAPVLDRLSKRFTEVWKETIEPLLDNFIGLFGDVADFVRLMWETEFQPFLNWIAQTIMPVVAPVLEALGSQFLSTFELIGDLLDGFITAARGVIEFLAGFFTHDWEMAWSGIDTIVRGIWDLFPDYITKMIEDPANNILTFLVGDFEKNWGQSWQNISDTFKNIWDNMPEFVKQPIRLIVGLINKMIDGVESGINYVISGLNTISIDIPDWVPKMGGKTFGFDIGEISLKRIPAFAKGGIIDSSMIALLGESGKEAVIPLERNTEWIDNVAKKITKKLAFKNLQLDLSVPKKEDYIPSIPDSGFSQFKSTMQMEMDAKMAELEFENRQVRGTLEEILVELKNKKLIVGDRDIFNANRRETIKFGNRTQKDPYPIYGRTH